jgi:CBS domain-containing protein
MKEFVRDLMSESPIAVATDTTLAEAARIMRDRDIGAVLVQDEEDLACGIVTDRDIVVRGLGGGGDPQFTTIGHICSRELVAIAAHEPAEHAVAVMRERGLRRLLVEDDGAAVGILSLGDLARDRDLTSALGQISSKTANR